MKIKVDGEDLEATTYAAKKILLDTNLLVYAHNRASPHYRQASYILVASTQGPLNGSISYQNILEFYSVMTNPRKVKPIPPLKDVQEICSDLWHSQRLRKIFPRSGTPIEAIKIAAEKGLRGPQLYGCFLALTARDNQVDHIWTDNVEDFRHFEFITAENPLTRPWELLEGPSEE